MWRRLLYFTQHTQAFQICLFNGDFFSSFLIYFGSCRMWNKSHALYTVCRLFCSFLIVWRSIQAIVNQRSALRQIIGRWTIWFIWSDSKRFQWLLSDADFVNQYLFFFLIFVTPHTNSKNSFSITVLLSHILLPFFPKGRKNVPFPCRTVYCFFLETKTHEDKTKHIISQCDRKIEKMSSTDYCRHHFRMTHTFWFASHCIRCRSWMRVCQLSLSWKKGTNSLVYYFNYRSVLLIKQYSSVLLGILYYPFSFSIGILRAHFGSKNDMTHYFLRDDCFDQRAADASRQMRKSIYFTLFMLSSTHGVDETENKRHTKL